ncbi:MAG: dihydropyrimidinase [Candidatus Obscuribacter sp.]|jgi:dihydropyrimidinase|nr:dihydropyrimidinase [Candidatus Obscuribacter sp.]MBK9622036.1 dihydropyrimidinase [Candidatus Obscuribacter sp.]MBK9774540.1 dihydropyrimidinase [Candidatus Obscuribacter sp.]MBL0185582.1 dihydropyrimidinase [Candidatus Obscuribacter sp.]MBP6351706.1 dihydropyrimidinase [Candidatus Obscuribacter sp.]
MKTLIKNGRIVTAVDDYHGDILIDGERISVIGECLEMEADQVIDAEGLLVIPGGIDAHTHMDMPFGGTTSADNFETGTRAAAHGGTTTIIDFAIQNKGQSLYEALDTWHAKAAGKAAIDYGFHMITTDMPRERLSEMKKLIDQEGVTSFKLFMAYPGVLLVDDATIFRAMVTAGEQGGLICMHAENGVVINEIVQYALEQGCTAPKFHALTRPTKAEAEGVNRAIALAEMAGSPVYIVHLSCYDALKKIKEARDEGIPAFAETCPQYLFLDISHNERENFEGAKYVMTPPLREKWNQEELWTGLRMNDLQTVSTDHCPFCFANQKQLGKDDFSKIPNGGPGVENRMSLIYTGGVVQGRINLNRFVEITSTSAAKIFGLFPRKGTIAVGSDADIVLFDPDKKWTISAKNHHMNVDYNCYEGMNVQGDARYVFSRGKLVIDKGQYLGKMGDGSYLKRSTVQHKTKESALSITKHK